MKKINTIFAAAVLVFSLLATGCGAGADLPAAGSGTVMAETGEITETAEIAEVAETLETAETVGMEPVYGEQIKDGIYSIKVDSSSSMFRITECKLTVQDGTMHAVMTMGGTGYLKLYMGTGEVAVEASEDVFIPYIETAEGLHTFEVPVEALDQEIDCSAFSKNKETWYDRILVFRADSLPADAYADGIITTLERLNLEDGNYMIEVSLDGGSGRASVESPTVLRVEEGKTYAEIIWSSSNYDYMKVNGEKIEAVSMEPNSTFEIPVSGFDWRIPVIANTIAMSEPHEIDYTLTFDSSTIKKAE